MAENGTAIDVNGFCQNGSLKQQTPLENSDEAPEAKDRYLRSQRLLLALVGLMGGVMLEFNRAGLSMAIVCMVNNTDVNTDVNTTSPVSEHAEFFWSKSEQAGILSASFYGYMVTQIPAGILAGRYGGKYVMLIGMLIGSISSLLLPIGARTSIYLVYVLRVILGASQGVYFPTMHCMWGIWAPPLERTKLLAICYSGTKIGSIAAFSLSGVLCEYGFDNGWPSQFYISGFHDAMGANDDVSSHLGMFGRACRIRNGLLSAVPYVSQGVSSVVSGQLADYLRSRKYLSTTATRRIFQTIGFIGTGVCVVCTGFVDADNRYVAVALLTCAMWFIGFGAAGFLKTQEEWQNVFYVCGGFCLLGTVVFGTQARGEVQPWAVDQLEVVVGEGHEQVPTVSSRVLEVNNDNLEIQIVEND
ncbi:uncharacterized transporter slc-17.2-like [Haliotis rubra]|uniref:uncharacterized transporter slc-17.2-like n=1 Tax=Haliotis rubra TaxID=36100 RepID=UPI001EE613DF|nr:uncharacterized transporter slc-17.2-like [Haliotis rubra]